MHSNHCPSVYTVYISYLKQSSEDWSPKSHSARLSSPQGSTVLRVPRVPRVGSVGPGDLLIFAVERDAANTGCWCNVPSLKKMSSSVGFG